MCQISISEITEIESFHKITLDSIFDNVLKISKLTSDELKTKSKKREISDYRALIVYVAKRDTKHSYPEIAKFLNYETHTSALNAFNKINDKHFGLELVKKYDLYTQLNITN